MLLRDYAITPDVFDTASYSSDEICGLYLDRIREVLLADRYLISNLMGISLPNGFDTTTDPRNITSWTRLDSKDRDDVQREFDPASSRHKLRQRFLIE